MPGTLPDLSTDELEILYNLDKDKIEAIPQLTELRNRYLEGYTDCAPDSYKARQYQIRIHQLKGFDPPDEIQPLLVRTATVYRTMGWYTTLRIFIGAVYNFTDLIVKKLIAASGLLPPLLKHQIFGIAGLTFGIELAIDSIIIGKAIATPYEIKISPWQRFLNIINKDNRKSRMINAGIWFVINFACFMLTGGFWGYVAAAANLAGYLNIIGFIGDVIHDHSSTKRELDKQLSLRDKIEDNPLLNNKIEFTIAKRKRILSCSLAFLLGYTLIVLAPIFLPSFAFGASSLGFLLFIQACVKTIYYRYCGHPVPAYEDQKKYSPNRAMDRLNTKANSVTAKPLSQKAHSTRSPSGWSRFCCLSFSKKGHCPTFTPATSLKKTS